MEKIRFKHKIVKEKIEISFDIWGSRNSARGSKGLPLPLFHILQFSTQMMAESHQLELQKF